MNSIVKERPIFFSGAEVRAILEGRKTQRRRVVKPQPPVGAEYPKVMTDGKWLFSGLGHGWKCPYGIPGDRLWVRETWSHTGIAVWTIEDARRASGNGRVIYRATDAEPCPGCWWPSIHMPREFSRIALEVVEVRVERLQEISVKDAIAEGYPHVGKLGRDVYHWDPRETIFWYRELWESINGTGSWKDNPWVWVVEFQRVGGVA